jgi:hypothetical protein
MGDSDNVKKKKKRKERKKLEVRVKQIRKSEVADM